ncbi:Fis family transcriptional regulator [Caldimonas brevitalea]|uniref:Fis family transcriptional regulator n=1 Tax=Caldimonas brevitalea TaxID=413882 RepID=A0A0G3BEI8_9BURK|nr:Fis family transcriptional regulator [Caldimonas brevitalea]
MVVVEDDEAFRAGVERSLQMAGYDVASFEDAESATRYLSGNVAAMVLTDLRLPRSDGLSVLEIARQKDREMPVVLMTGHGDIPTAIQAIRAGAYDFLEKPFSRERLLAVVARASDQYRLVLENRQLRNRLAESAGIDKIVIGDSAPIRELRDLILRLAPTPADVLINGETGTGKELVARCLHDFGHRSGNFVAVNCAAIPENLFESELFGHEAGAFTGAGKQRIGKIEHAKNGTLFLDEIEAMPLSLQAKVLRVLQEREVERLGNNKPIPVNFRVVAATKVSLEELSHKGQFRPDLFYRLNVVSLQVPPLRDRIGDILTLFQGFLQQASLRYQMPAPPLTPEQHQALLASRWPGNVRELKSCAERMLLGLPIFVDGKASSAAATRSFDESVAIIERSLLEEALRRHGGSVKPACAELKLTLATMYRKLKALGVDPAAYKQSGAEDETA